MRSTTSWLAFIVGLWLIASPFILGYSGSSVPTTNEVIVGIVAAVLALILLVAGGSYSWAGWILALVGIWEIAAPFALATTGLNNVMANEIISGLVLVIFGGGSALAGAETTERVSRFGPSYYSEERPRRTEEEKPQEEQRAEAEQDREPEV